MRRLILILSVCSLFACGFKEEKEDIAKYDCENLIAEKTDKVTGKKYIGSKNVLIVSDDGEFGLGILFTKSKRKIIITIAVSGAGSCIDKESEINILFRDTTRLTLYNQADYNCDNRFTLYLSRILEDIWELDQFKTKEIETFRVWTSKKHTTRSHYVQKDFTREQSKIFMNTLKCISD